jgi:hypothetical protein
MRVLRAPLLGWIVTVLCGPSLLYAQPTDRVTQAVDTTKVRALVDHVPAWANPNNSLGALPGNQKLDPMTLILSRSPEQEQELSALMSTTTG